ncbi:MAG: hypothetical protein HN350_14225, partial [Phycisphaerales bacterium]|nr:hypothetical protein [Phycisphaerales bacterium]
MIMNNDRDNIKELLSVYVDGETTPKQTAEVQRAVAQDPELALELHELKAAKRLLCGLPLERAPRGFVRKVMVRAERKHLLGDHHAGGAFRAARWITFAAAAVVLISAGLGIIAINRMQKTPDPSVIASDLNSDDHVADTPGTTRFDNVDGVSGKAFKAMGTETKANLGYDEGAAVGGGKLVLADVAYDYAISNALNTTIYTADLRDTVAVLEKTLVSNSVQPLALGDASDDTGWADNGSKVQDKASDSNTSQGELNFSIKKLQNDDQVQFVVLASDKVITKLNGDLNRIASEQMVSQAPLEEYELASATNHMVSRAGPRRSKARKAVAKPASPVVSGPDTIAKGTPVDAPAKTAKDESDVIALAKSKKSAAPSEIGSGAARSRGVSTP